ncbi:hypothetical protein [Burkholderia anthina]|uniref:hypothetical protein n=1 Tax=Burkholderia anthina TaxID=179879 RepID=UPI00158EDDF0|nr:hypothetical protein [Burkholderia anthina]
MSANGTAEHLSRERLYEEVWTTPMKLVGTKYGLSGTEVRRMCDKLQIPVPAQGHWTRVQMGLPIQRQPLQPLKQPQTTSDVRRRRASRPSSKEVPQSQELKTSVTPADVVADQISKAPAHWHEALNAFRERIKKAVANAETLKRKYEWEQSHPGKRHPSHLNSYGSWESFCDAGQLLAATHRKSVARLSLCSYERGLAVLNAICVRAEAVGYVVDMGKGDSRLRLTRDQAYVEIRVGEEMDAGFRPKMRSWETEQVKRLTPSGRLFVFIEQQGTGETKVTDRKDELLEQQFDRIFELIAIRHQGSVSRLAEWAQWDRDRKAAETQRQEEERQRKEVQEQAERERQLRNDFIAEAENWDKARMLRAYLDALDTRLAEGGSAMDGYAEWRVWAQVVVEELDRSAKKVKPALTARDPAVS